MSSYTAEQRAEAVALAASIGPLKAAKQLGLPKSTVALWMHRPAAAPIIAEANRAIAERLEEAHSEALSAVLAGLRDPRSRLGDRAAALRTLGEQLALAKGRATSNVELHSNSTETPMTGLTSTRHRGAGTAPSDGPGSMSSGPQLPRPTRSPPSPLGPS